MISATTSLADMAFEVCTALSGKGFTAVLTGGSAATFYAPAAYQSKDLDFVLALRGQQGDEALASLGFERKADFYVHPRSVFSLEFPPGPLAIGEDLITNWRTVKRRRQTLHVLTPTDSCRDRLASYLFWNDLRGLEQALAVHLACGAEVDLEVVRDWCAREGHAKRFGLYESRWRASRPTKK